MPEILNKITCGGLTCNPERGSKSNIFFDEEWPERVPGRQHNLVNGTPASAGIHELGKIPESF